MDSSLKHLLSLGREHFARNDYSAAEAPLRDCLRVAPDLADAHYMLGVILHDRGDLAEARACFERALAINPGYTEAALNLAITCNDLGMYAEARRVSVRISERSHASDRIDPYARGKLANLHALVARAYEELGLAPEAADEYERALGLCPDFSDLRTRRASVLRAMGDHEAALRELDVAVSHSPDFVPAHVARGVTLFSLGRREEARAAWQRALQVEPDHRAARVFLRMAEKGATSIPSQLPPPSHDELEGFEVHLLDDEEKPA